MYAVAVVGAGPIGLSLAEKLQSHGWNTVVLEEHSEIGKPIQCTGLISKKGYDELGLKADESIVNEVKGARIHSPNELVLEVKKDRTVALVIERDKFDQLLYRKAVQAGAEVKLNTKLIDVNKETLFTKFKGGRGELLKARLIVGADGVTSKVKELMDLHTSQSNFLHAYQVKAKGSFDPEIVEVFFGNYAKDFFAWIVPESNKTARIGLASSKGNIQEQFEKFVEEKKLEIDVFDYLSGLIPVGEPLEKIVKDNLLLVGDAAFQTKASTGGGVITGITAGNILAESIDNHFTHKQPLTRYQDKLKKLNQELLLHWRIRKYFNSLNNEQLNQLFEKLKKAKAEEFLSREGDMDKPSKFLNKIWFKPSLWGLIPEGMKILKG